MNAGNPSTSAGELRAGSAAPHGGEHWIRERLSSIALLLLGSWLLASLLFLPSLDQRTMIEWLRMPSVAVPMAIFIVFSFAHALDGMKVIVDDYVHEPGNNFALNTVLLFAAVAGAGLALFALAKIAFGGQA